MFLLFCVPLLTQAKLKIAIIDTGFCTQPIQQKKQLVLKSFDATHLVGDLKCNADFLDQERFHGENVLKTFFQNLDPLIELEAQPIIVFDHLGKQKLAYWENALKFLDKYNPDLIISASGIKLLTDVYPKKINFTWFLSAPRISPFIKKGDLIFPQVLSNQENVFLFGNYLEGNLLDNGLLYQEKIMAFEKDSSLKFNGSSYAVAVLSAKILNRCDVKNLTQFKACIKQYAKISKNNIREII